MKRIPITQDGQNAGWFNIETATKFEENTTWNGNNHISLATGSQWEHEALYHTKSGNWVLNHWSQWQGSTERFERIAPDAAAEWLIKNGHDEAAVKHFPAEVAQSEV